MPDKTHHYRTTLAWTGNRGSGTSRYTAYDRTHVIGIEGKPPIPGSSDPVFRGDPARYNPEELLVAALSACHMLQYLHLCSANHVIVTGYADAAEGEMIETPDGGGHFTRVVLRPRVTVTPESDADRALSLHQEAHAKCFIASSVNFPVEHEPSIESDAGPHASEVGAD